MKTGMTLQRKLVLCCNRERRAREEGGSSADHTCSLYEHFVCEDLHSQFKMRMYVTAMDIFRTEHIGNSSMY